MVTQLPWKSLEFAIYMSDQVFRGDDTFHLLESYLNNLAPESDVPVDIRNCLSSCCKNKMAQYRNGIRALDLLILKEEFSESKDVIMEIRDQCVKKIIEARDYSCFYAEKFSKLEGASLETKVFGLKMMGDYNRYVAEAVTDNEDVKAASLKAYTEANELAMGLDVDHTGRMGLALNLSVFYYEIMDDKSMAEQIANAAFTSAQAAYNDPSHEMSDDVTNILQLLKDNLVLWRTGDDDSLDKSSNDDI